MSALRYAENPEASKILIRCNYFMVVLLLCGSVAQKSHTLALLRHIERLFQDKGIRTNFWDLKTDPIPFVRPEYHRDPTQHPEKIVRKFVQAVEDVDVIILGTPLYHGSYSGVLKNALDNLRADPFRNKWVGLVGNAATTRADQVSFSHLRHVVNALVGHTAQTQVGTHRGDYEEQADAYVLIDEDIKERCQRLVDELLRQAHDQKNTPNH